MCCVWTWSPLTSFSKLTRLSWKVLLPSWMNVMSDAGGTKRYKLKSWYMLTYREREKTLPGLVLCKAWVLLQWHHKMRTFEQQRKKGDLWRLHLLEGVPVGLVIQRRILWRYIFKRGKVMRAILWGTTVCLSTQALPLQRSKRPNTAGGCRLNHDSFYSAHKDAVSSITPTYRHCFQLWQELLEFSRNFLWETTTGVDSLCVKTSGFERWGNRCVWQKQQVAVPPTSGWGGSQLQCSGPWWWRRSSWDSSELCSFKTKHQQRQTFELFRNPMQCCGFATRGRTILT